MRATLFILLMLMTSIFMLSCDIDRDDTSDTDYNFLSYTDFNEWFQSHTWAVTVSVLASSEIDNFTYIVPELDCFMEDIVSENDTFNLSINGTDVPLDYYNGNVFVDPMGPDIYLDYTTDLHIILKINGVDKINKKILIPSPIIITAPESTDFTAPVSFTWSSAKTADYQSTYCFVGHRPPALSYHSHYFYRMISKYAREYTLPASEYLSFFNDEYGSVENPAYLELYTVAVFARNFEEQNNNVVCAEAIASVNITNGIDFP